MGRNERPPRDGVNLIGWLAQVAPVQRLWFLIEGVGCRYPTSPSEYVCSSMWYFVQCAILGQLWRLLVTPAVGPGPWTEERTDERKLVEYESRQLGGFYVRRPPRRWKLGIAAAKDAKAKTTSELDVADGT